MALFFAHVLFQIGSSSAGGPLGLTRSCTRTESACMLKIVINASDIRALRRFVNNIDWSQPFLIRQGATHWKSVMEHKQDAAEFKRRLREKYGTEHLKRVRGSVIAYFSARSPYLPSTTLQKHLDAIENAGDDDDNPIAFQHVSDYHDGNNGLAQRIFNDGLFDFAIRPDILGKESSYRAFPQTDLQIEYVASVGGNGDGLAFHTHGKTCLGLVSGRKEWLLMAPGDMTENILRGSVHVSMYLKRLCAGVEDWPPGLLYCDQRPGDLLYLPMSWWHATHNDGTTIGFGGQTNNDKVTLKSNTSSDDWYRQELVSLTKILQGGTEEKAQGLAESFAMAKEMPSRFFLSDNILDGYGSSRNAVLSSARLVRLRRHLLFWEKVEKKRGPVPKADLSLFHAWYGNYAINTLSNPPLALSFYHHALRLDPENVMAWHGSAYALLQLRTDGRTELDDQDEEIEMRKDEEIEMRLKMALKYDHNYELSKELLKSLWSGGHTAPYEA